MPSITYRINSDSEATVDIGPTSFLLTEVICKQSSEDTGVELEITGVESKNVSQIFNSRLRVGDSVTFRVAEIHNEGNYNTGPEDDCA